MKVKHNQYKTRLYKKWQNIRQGRSYYTTYTTEWEEFKDFYNWAVSSGYKEGLTIDRINPKKGYGPKNCQWISHAENSVKDKRIFTKEDIVKIVDMLSYFRSKTIAKVLNVSVSTIQHISSGRNYGDITGIKINFKNEVWRELK